MTKSPVAMALDDDCALAAAAIREYRLKSLPVVERLCRNGAPANVPVVALTRAMSPDTLMRAEALGAAGALRTPAGADQLAAVLGPMLDGPPS